MAVFKKNPFTWDNTSKSISSNVIDVVMQSKMNISTSNFSEEAVINIARDSSQFPAIDSFYLKPSEENSTASTKEYLKYHCMTRSSNYTSINFEVQPEEVGIKFAVYMKKGGKPDIKRKHFDHSFELPDLSSCKINDESVLNTDISDEDSHDVVYIHPSNCSRQPYNLFVPTTHLNGTGEFCFGEYKCTIPNFFPPFQIRMGSVFHC